MTLSEILLWQEIRKKSLGVEFHRQVPIDNYIVDFYCHELNLVIEVDGASHYIDNVYDNDVLRQKKLERLGLVLIRFDDSEIKNDINNVLRALELKIKELKTHKLSGEKSLPSNSLSRIYFGRDIEGCQPNNKHPYHPLKGIVIRSKIIEVKSITNKIEELNGRI